MAQRIVHIRRDNAEGKLLSSREATSLKAALQDYYKETLSQQGYSEPQYHGNTMTVLFMKQNTTRFVALEAK